MGQVVKVKKQCAQRIKAGNPLIVEQDLIGDQRFNEGEIVEIVDAQNGLFLAKAIMGKQNKGIGWVFTQQRAEKFDNVFFEKCLTQAKSKRECMSIASNAYRLFNGESDGIGGLTIDIYQDVAIFSWYSQGIYHYQQQLIEQFCRVNPTITAIYEKCRFQNAPHESAWVKGLEKEHIIIEENGVKYATYMNDGLMTGIFLDQREVRQYIQQRANGQHLLNTFSYTGAFSVAAAKGGACRTASVDVAKRSTERTKEHFKLNDIDMSEHALYVMDVFDYLKYAKKKQLSFDWVVLDPPSFARTKKRTFSVSKNYTELLADAIRVTAPFGHLVISTNAANLPVQEFEQMIKQTFHQCQKHFVIEKVFRLPQDFTTLEVLEPTNYLKVYIVRLDE